MACVDNIEIPWLWERTHAQYAPMLRDLAQWVALYPNPDFEIFEYCEKGITIYGCSIEKFTTRLVNNLDRGDWLLGFEIGFHNECAAVDFRLRFGELCFLNWPK